MIRKVASLLSGQLKIVESFTDDLDMAGKIQLETGCALSVALDVATINRIEPGKLRIACSREEYEPFTGEKASMLLGREIEIYVPHPLKKAELLKNVRQGA